MRGLADAARSRSEADWLVGINGTRAMTAFNSRDGGFFLTTVGRVQTPTLSIVVEREEKIRKHVARDYWEVKAAFLAKAGTYEGKWFDPKWKKNPTTTRSSAPTASWNEADAPRHRAGGARPERRVSEESKPSTQSSPLLYDLTTLQREANWPLRLFGQDHAVIGAGAVRAAQGADLPAHRFAGAAGGLPGRREEDDGGAGRRATCPAHRASWRATPSWR